MKVSGLFIYPIKSCAGISLQKADLTERGLAYDRRWMLIDAKGKFLSQRKHPEMARIQTKIVGDKLHVWHLLKKIKPLEIPLQIKQGNTREVRLWDDEFPASIFDERANQWFSGVLGFPCQLVYMHDESLRTVDPKYAQQEEIVNMADGYPYLIIGQKSLDDLNQRLLAAGELAVPMNRFRPNLVFEGTEAFEEDNWIDITIGKVDFTAVKPCARCILTTIDQQTAIAGKEPLKTLSAYRKSGAKVLFGMNLLHRELGVLHLGDKIVVKSKN